MLRHFTTTRQRLHATQDQLRAAEEALRVADAIFQNVEAVMVTNARGRIQRVNAAFSALTGYAADEVVGKTPWLLRSGHHDEAFYVAMRAAIASTGRWQGEIWDRHKSGAVFPKWLTIVAVSNGAGEITHMVATYVDIRERKRAEAQIHQLAFYDVLTELPNRALLRERLQSAMRACADGGGHGALLLLDLDDFRTLNDTRGHSQGDALLQQVAQRLAGCVAGNDTVARLGGDEFAIVLADLCSAREQAAARAEAFGRKVLQVLRPAYVLGDGDHHGTASMGVALFGGTEQDVDTVLKQAEMAMYQAKASGRDTLHFFDAALERAITERVQLERALREGIERGELVLHYQPQLAALDGGLHVVGAEALVRWQHPGRGLLGPGLFIPLAEETGLILALGRWVLRTACAQLAAWATQPDLASVTLAVNVSAPQFLEDGFADEVLALLRHAGARPERLKIELTESMLMNGADTVIAIMRTLQEQGVQFSLDDFGTGYSSLSYLRRLPLDQLKIDQSFVRDLAGDDSDAATAHSIAGAIAALGHSLGLTVIAEGVETAAQRDALAAIGCTTWQGYFFSRPLPLEAFEAWLRTRAA